MTNLSVISRSPAGSPQGEITPEAHKTRYTEDKRTTAHECTAEPGNKLGMPWKYVLNEDEKLTAFKCPTCGNVVRNLKAFNDNATTCGECGWHPALLTKKQAATLRTDPALKPAQNYMKRLEERDNKHHINGKAKRHKKAISAACY